MPTLLLPLNNISTAGHSMALRQFPAISIIEILGAYRSKECNVDRRYRFFRWSFPRGDSNGCRLFRSGLPATRLKCSCFETCRPGPARYETTVAQKQGLEASR